MTPHQIEAKIQELKLQLRLLERRQARAESRRRPAIAPLVCHCRRCDASTPILNGYGRCAPWQWDYRDHASDSAEGLFDELPQLTLSALDAGWVVETCVDHCCLSGVWCPECREYATSTRCIHDF